MSLFTNRKSDDPSPVGGPVDALPDDAHAWDPPADVVPPAPKRRLDDEHRAQAGNVEIDVAGLLQLLEIDDADDLPAISEAWQRFLAEHQPLDTDDEDSAALKLRICREINAAYASFRLTRAA